MKTILLSLSLIFSTMAIATDLPEGGDALFHQVRNANIVTIATLTKVDRTGYLFTTVKDIRGKTPETFTVPLLDADDHSGTNLRVKGTYLLFLNGKRILNRLGRLSLAMGGFSVQEVKPTQIADYELVVSDYVNFRGDKEELKLKLLEHVGRKVPYLQYSAVKDVTMRNRLSKAEVSELAEKLKAGRLVDPRAKLEIIRNITNHNLTVYSPVLETMILNTNENVSVRTASLVSLDRMGQTDAIRRVAPTLVDDRSGRIRRVTIDIIKPRN